MEGVAVRRVRDPIPQSDSPNDRVRVEAALRDANLPERYWGVRHNLVKSTAVRDWAWIAMRDAAQWLAEGKGWYLHGPFASGKSSIAALLLQNAVARGEVCLWLPTYDVPRVRFREDEAAKRLDDRLRRCDLLVLDDLGSEAFSLVKGGGAALEAVARTVYDRQRSLVVTSNVSWNAFPSTYGAAPAIVSVIQRLVTPITVVV